MPQQLEQALTGKYEILRELGRGGMATVYLAHDHDLARRVDANWLAGLVARHILDIGDAREMAHALAYDIARATYKLDQPVSG